MSKNSNQIKFKRKIFQQFEDPEKETELRDAFNFFIVIIWIGIFILGYSFFNYYLISAFLGIQLFFLLINKEEILTLTPTSFTYQFLLYKKTRRIQSYQEISIKYDKNPYTDNSFKRKYIFTECILLQSDKFEFKIIKTNWSEQYDELKDFLEKNFRENKTIKRPFALFKFERDLSLFFLIILFSLSILTLGVAIENNKNTPLELSYFEGTLQKDGYYTKGLLGQHISKDSGSLELRIQEFPEIKFSLSKERISEMKRNNNVPIFKKNDTIGLFIDEEDYVIKLKKMEDYPYFTSHIFSKSKVNIYGLTYNEQNLLYPKEFTETRTRNEKFLFIIPLLFWVIYLVIIFSNKIKYIQ